MSLHAHVYCDCFEKNKLLTPPPSGLQFQVDEDGSLGLKNRKSTIDEYLVWDHWREKLACVHPGGILLRHYLGNISLIGLLRDKLEQDSSRFELLITKVVYSGSHAGDYVPAHKIPKLQKELQSLNNFNGRSSSEKHFLNDFQSKMSELATFALSVKKPIVF